MLGYIWGQTKSMFSEFAFRANNCRHISRSVTAEKE